MEARVAAVKTIYEAVGQSHVFKFFDKLSTEQKDSLLTQLEKIDVKRVLDTYKLTNSTTAAAQGRPEPLPVVTNLKEASDAQKKEWRTQGLSLIARGKVAYLLLAGGQGTRLGTSDPKGCYDIGLPSHKSLFQLMAERLIRLRQLAGGDNKGIPWYVMTSPMTHGATEEFFARNKFFGLQQTDVFFFQQGTLPCLSLEGDVLLEAPDRVACAPDGNGGIYRALRESGALSDMKRRGVESVHASSVDNALVLPADPAFVGYSLERNADCAAKVVPKASASEAVGVLCSAGSGGAQVVEYSELSAEAAAETDPATGALRLNHGNICNHLYTVTFLERAAELATPYHVAKKKIPAVTAEGETVTPGANNGVKLELFIFDCFPHATNFACAQVVREEEFGPVKNAPGAAVDSPDTARALLLTLGRRYAEAAGLAVSGTQGVEVSPLVSYNGEGLEGAEVGSGDPAVIKVAGEP